jgi:two-component system sensor histidine kinase EvgS
LLGVRGALSVGLLLGLCVALAQKPGAPRKYHFHALPPDAAVSLAPGLITEQERAYLAALPDVRVAVPLPPPQPYAVVGADGSISGIQPELLAHLAQALGLRLRPVVYPDWPSALEAAKRREVDMLMTLGVSRERMEYLEFTLGATPVPAALFALPGANGAPPTPPERARFVIERDYLPNDFVKRQYPQAKIVTVQTTSQALAAVAEGRADYYVGSLLEAMDFLAREPHRGVQVQRLVTVGTGYYHFGVRKDWAPLARILNKGIAAARASPAHTSTLDSAISALPDSVAFPRPADLSPTESALLVQRPAWRLGAVRGLSMLNDVDAEGVHSGIAAEYAEQVAQQLGVALQVMPFASVADMLDALRAGSIDVVPFLTRTPQRAKEFAFTVPYVSMPYMIVARTDAPLYWDLGSLRGQRLAMAAQHPLRELVAERYPDIQVVTVANGNEAMDAVANGAADAAAEVKLFANLRINGDNDGRLRAVAEIEDLPASFHFAVAAQQRALAPLIDRALDRIPMAERERMLRRWVALDLGPGFAWRRYLPVMLVAVAALMSLTLLTWWWMRRLRREVAARRASEEQLNDIGATIPLVAFRQIIGHDGVFKEAYYSGGAEAFLGVAPDPGKSIVENLAPRVPVEQRAQLERAQHGAELGGHRFKVSCAYAHPCGREMWLHVEAVARAGKSATAWTGYVVDVTSERELQARVAREAEARNLLLASASHELRAPTHTLTLALQSLAEEASAGEQGDGLDKGAKLRVAQDAARTLTQLLNDVLDAARLDQGAMQLRPQLFSLHELIAQVAQDTRAWADRKGLVFEFEVRPEVPAMVRLDPLRLRQLLTNLLSNAVKYTDRGHVALRVAMRSGSTAQRLVFTVSDTGCGIASEQLEALFLPYTTAPAAASGVPEGSTGLGLSICRRLAGLMGGVVSLQSEPGQGTQAQVELPLAWTHASAPHPPAQTQGSVIVCDDDDTARVLMSHMLSSRGYDVIECSDGEQALQHQRTSNVQALVTDLDMAGIGGLELIERWRAHEALQGQAAARVIVCSGSSVPPETSGSAPAGYDAWLVKPVEMPVLQETMRALGVLSRAGACDLSSATSTA